MKLYRKIRKLINFTYDFDRYLIKSFVKKLGEKQIIALEMFLEAIEDNEDMIVYDPDFSSIRLYVKEYGCISLFHEGSQEEYQANEYFYGNNKNTYDMSNHLALQLFVDMYSGEVCLGLREMAWNHDDYYYIDRSDIKLADTAEKLKKNIDQVIQDYINIVTSENNLNKIRAEIGIKIDLIKENNDD